MTWYVKLQCWGTWEQFISTCRSLYLFHWPAKFFHLLNHNSDIFSLVRPLHVPHQSLTGQITWSYFPHRWYQESANFLYKGSDYNLQAKSSLPHVLVQPPPKKRLFCDMGKRYEIQKPNQNTEVLVYVLPMATLH